MVVTGNTKPQTIKQLLSFPLWLSKKPLMSLLETQAHMALWLLCSQKGSWKVARETEVQGK